MMNSVSRASTDDRDAQSIGNAVVICLLGLIAAWTASGGLGVIGHPLRHAVSWLALAAAVLLSLPWRGRHSLVVLPLSILLAVAMTATRMPAVNILAAAVVLSAVAMTRTARGRLMIGLTAEAIVLLAVFQTARTSIPIVWQIADAIGEVVGRLVGNLSGRPLWLGASFGGVDFLLVSTYLAVMTPLRCGRAARSPRRIVFHPVSIAVAAVIVGHTLYLVCLSSAPALLERLPQTVHQSRVEAYYQPPVITWADMSRDLVPWNMMALALVIHTGIAAGILTLASSGVGTDPPADPRPEHANRQTSGQRSLAFQFRRAWIVPMALIILSASMPFCVGPPWKAATLKSKKIVFYEKGFLNWLRPQHGNYGRFSIGMYGMLPSFLESLGAQPLISPDLSENDLRDADALVLMFPNEPWKEGQLERIWDFVKQGGCLLVMGEHTTREPDGSNHFNEVLSPTAMRVRFDSATFEVGGWLQSYETLWHTLSAGMKDTENNFGVVIGASVSARPPARPLIVGRWGWADPGDETSGAAMMGNGRYDNGERLGDLVLAAEQRFGAGKIVVFGDTSTLSNGINIACHPFTSRLMAYVADVDSTPMPAWRQLLAIVFAAALVVIFSAGVEPRLLAIACLVMSATLLACTERTRAAQQLLPNKSQLSSDRLAYIGASHLEAYSRESWRDDGTMGLRLTLMRHGFLTLALPELSAERLSRADLFISIAPSRQWSSSERAVIERFVREGGVYVCTVGVDRVGPSEALLHQLGFKIGTIHWNGDQPVNGSEPLGHFKSPYTSDGEYSAFVRFHAAWPVYCSDRRALVITSHSPDKPVIVLRRLGKGLVVVVGDSCFAMNKNLEKENGEPFEGLRENADFWNWLLAFLFEDAE